MNSILFCLPPSIGLGDSVEYALAIKAIINQCSFVNIGIAYIGRFHIIFKRYFKIENLYEDFISEEEINQYDSIFHFTLEIEELFYQKYNRYNIELLITKYFNIKQFRNTNFSNVNSSKKSINKLSIFPISNSPIRTLGSNLINLLADNYIGDYEIEIILDKQSSISNEIDYNINNNKINKLHPRDLYELLNIIEKIDFGIFVDSGPLHIAKIISKKGIFISTSVGGNVLLDDFKTIVELRNNYKSSFCKSPCGLTNIINYKNDYGCFETLRIKKDEIMKTNRLKNFQRGQLKNNYVKFINNPVGCIKNIDYNMIIKLINKTLSN